MTHAAAEVFSFETNPNKAQLCQFWAAFSNYVFGTNDPTVAAAEGNVTAAFAHSEITHRYKYGSNIADGRELTHLIYHSALGGLNTNPTKNKKNVFAKEQLDQAFHHLYDKDNKIAKYSCNEQKTLIQHSASSSNKHLFVGLGCGQGKTACITVPKVAEKIFRKRLGSFVLIVPYKPLAFYQYHSIKDILGNLSDCLVTYLDSVTCQEASDNHQLPGIFQEHALPDVIVITMEGIKILLDSFLNEFKELSTQGLIHRIVVDEVHTILAEIFFRKAYSVYTKLSILRIPIILMSGSLPTNLVYPLCKSLDIAKHPTDIDIISNNIHLNKFPKTFKFVIHHDLQDIITHVVRNIHCTLTYHNNKYGIHVVCASIPQSQAIYDKLLSKSINVGLVNSEIDKYTQQSTMEKWQNSKLTVFVSTSGGLVGNENPSCRFVFICGYIHSVVAITQAIGRLRNQQRDGGAVRIFLHSVHEHKLKEMVHNDTAQINTLIPGVMDEKYKSTLLSIIGTKSLYDWTQSKQCRLSSLASLFGKNEPDCECCDNCTRNPILTVAKVAERNFNIRKNKKIIAKDVMNYLTQKCLNCSLSTCNGEQCIKNVCYKCGNSNHFSRKCDVPWNQYLKQVNGCFYCIEISETPVIHQDKKLCPMKRRLRTLFHTSFKKKHTSLMSASPQYSEHFKQYLLHHISSLDRYHNFLCSFEHRIPKVTAQLRKV